MTDTRQCEWCTKPFTPPPSAPHKRFCCSAHRDAWHARQRKEVSEELARRRLAGAEAALAQILKEGEPDATTE